MPTNLPNGLVPVVATTRPLARRSRRALASVLAAASLAAAACSSPEVAAGPRAERAPSASLISTVLGNGAVLRVLDCAVGPDARTLSDSALIGPEGGRLAVGRNVVNIPAGAVPSAETFVLTVPDGRAVKVDVRAVGYEHYTFAAPVTVTVDYARCGDLGGVFGLVRPTLHGWFVDSQTGTPLEDMGGVTDAAARTHSFSTPHFSNYLLAE